MVFLLQEFEKFYCNPHGIIIKNYQINDESLEYSACQFQIQSTLIHFRSGKITPTKIGQFVTFWKRNVNGITQPYDLKDSFDNLIVYVKTSTHRGFFNFPKKSLLEHGILTSVVAEGKRGFRVYPAWDKADNVQAKKTQSWQLKYFLSF